MTVLLDDHLLRDWMARRDDALVAVLSGEPAATTNLWYARLCKSAARATGGALLAGWSEAERRALIAGLVALPDDIAITPMRALAWQMGELIADHQGLSTLGAEAVAAALATNGRVLVSIRDDGPGIRACCEAVGVGYEALAR
ncbi:MAG: hypothetical protein WD232_06705 [Acidimicrobiales bacterium]